MTGLRGISILDTYLDLAELRAPLPGEPPPDAHPVTSYLWGNVSERNETADQVVAHLDKYGIERAQLNVSRWDYVPVAQAVLAAHPGRFTLAIKVNPHAGLAEVSRIAEAKASLGTALTSISIVPFNLSPAVPPTDRRFYPVYAKCAELGLPVNINVGIPGPRVPGAMQDPLFLDQVCYDLPELTIVMRHCGEPWEAMCAKLLLKWPNLYYATSGFAPKYYPRAVLDFASRRGADKLIYAGYFPGISYERIMSELAELPLRDHVWAPFLRENAARVYGM